MKINNCVIIPITELSDIDKVMILDWRNHDNIRKWMYNSSFISKVSHFKFIENLKTDRNNEYFLVEQNSIKIGVIYFNKIDFINKSAYFGLYVNPLEKSRGKGSKLIELSIKYAFEKLELRMLKLEVFNTNEIAINLYHKFNFNVITKKKVNNNTIIRMELKNENR